MDEESSTLFDSYYGEFQAYQEKADRLLGKIRNMKPGQARSKIIGQLDKKFNQMESVLNNMEHEAHSNKILLLKQREAYESYKELQNDFIKIKTKRTDKEELFEYDNEEGLEDDNRSRLVRATEAAEDQQETVDRSLKALDQIDERADNTLERLVNQRGVIEKAIENVQEIQAEGSQGARVINRMRKRQLTNKLVFLCIIVILIIGIIVVLFFGVIKPFIIDKLAKGDDDKKEEDEEKP